MYFPLYSIHSTYYRLNAEAHRRIQLFSIEPDAKLQKCKTALSFPGGSMLKNQPAKAGDAS